MPEENAVPAAEPAPETEAPVTDAATEELPTSEPVAEAATE